MAALDARERAIVRTQLEAALHVFECHGEFSIADCLIAALAHLDRQDDA